jgi:hypothetical protein
MNPTLKRLAPALLAPLLLMACTGTTEPPVTFSLAVVNGGGSELRTVTPEDAASDTVLPVTGAVDVEVLPGGTQVVVAFKDRLELRDASLKLVSVLPAPDFTPCYVRLRASPQRDRIAALSDCGAGAAQRLAVYRSDTTLAFTATIPAPTPQSSDQTRFAVTNNQTVWFARPALGGGTDLIKATFEGIKVVTPIPLTNTIYDLATLGTTLYAATDDGVRAVDLDKVVLLAQVPALKLQAKRLYGSDRLLGIWLSGEGSQALNIWDGSKVGTPAPFSTLIDLTFAPDRRGYALTGTGITQFDTDRGLSQGNWQSSNVTGGLNDARAAVFLTPP